MVFYLMFLSDKGKPCYWTMTNNLILYKELFKLTYAISCPLTSYLFSASISCNV